jgi:hypothetical protein
VQKMGESDLQDQPIKKWPQAQRPKYGRSTASSKAAARIEQTLSIVRIGGLRRTVRTGNVDVIPPHKFVRSHEKISHLERKTFPHLTINLEAGLFRVGKSRITLNTARTYSASASRCARYRIRCARPGQAHRGISIRSIAEDTESLQSCDAYRLLSRVGSGKLRAKSQSPSARP